MSNFIEIIQTDFEIFGVVLDYRIRSFVLLCAAFAIPAVMLMVTTNLLSTSTIPGLENGTRPVLGLLALVMLTKLLFLAVQTYVKDRKAILRF